MKQFLLSLATLTLAITCGCGGGTSMSGSSAQLRAIETTPNAAFDIQLDGHALFASNAKTAYAPVALGSHTLEVTASGTSTALASLPATFAANTSQTVIVAGATEDQSLTAFMVAEDTTPPAAGQIKLRFVHGAHEISPIDIYLTDAGAQFPQRPTFANVPYKSATDLLVRPAQNFSLCWTLAGVTNPFTGGPQCGIVETIIVGGKFPMNSTFVLPDPPNLQNLPPGTFTFVQFHVYPN